MMKFKNIFLRFSINIFPPLFFNRIYLKSISSDYRAMTTYAQSIINEMKNIREKEEDKTY